MSKLPPGPFTPQQMPRVMRDFASAIERDSFASVFQAMEYILREDFHDHFIQKLGDDGPWAPRKDNLPHPLLRKTGKMHLATTRLGAPGNISIAGERELTFGVDGSVVDYANYQQYGTSRMVARPYIWISEDAEDRAAEAFADGVYDLLVG
jgi:hypothetical protein